MRRGESGGMSYHPGDVARGVESAQAGEEGDGEGVCVLTLVRLLVYASASCFLLCASVFLRLRLTVAFSRLFSTSPVFTVNLRPEASLGWISPCADAWSLAFAFSLIVAS